VPEKKTLKRAEKDKREGKAPSTQAGEFVREEMEHIREGKHGARNPKQAIAIGLSKARRAGVKLQPPKKGRTTEATRKRAEHDLEKGQTGAAKQPSKKQSAARREVLKREPRAAASKQALSKQAKQAAEERRKRGPVTEGARGHSGSAKKKAGAPKTAANKSPAKKNASAKGSARKKTAKR
jgi:hypothetical protein